jgi:hypothetical protein
MNNQPDSASIEWGSGPDHWWFIVSSEEEANWVQELLDANAKDPFIQWRKEDGLLRIVRLHLLVDPSVPDMVLRRVLLARPALLNVWVLQENEQPARSYLLAQMNARSEGASAAALHELKWRTRVRVLGAQGREAWHRAPLLQQLMEPDPWDAHDWRVRWRPKGQPRTWRPNLSTLGRQAFEAWVEAQRAPFMEAGVDPDAAMDELYGETPGPLWAGIAPNDDRFDNLNAGNFSSAQQEFDPAADHFSISIGFGSVDDDPAWPAPAGGVRISGWALVITGEIRIELIGTDPAAPPHSGAAFLNIQAPETAEDLRRWPVHKLAKEPVTVKRSNVGPDTPFDALFHALLSAGKAQNHSICFLTLE